MTFQKKYITIILQGRKPCLLFTIKGKKWYSTKPPEDKFKLLKIIMKKVKTFMKNTLNPKIHKIKINNNEDQLLDQLPEQQQDQPSEQQQDQPLEQQQDQPPEQQQDQPPEQLPAPQTNYLKNNKLYINMVNSEPTPT